MVASSEQPQANVTIPAYGLGSVSTIATKLMTIRMRVMKFVSVVMSAARPLSFSASWYMWMLRESVMLSAKPTINSPLTIVTISTLAAPKPMISPMLVTMAAVPPKLLSGQCSGKAQRNARNGEQRD